MAALIGVAGTISGKNGIEDIQLNNAATEATLRLLLQSSLTANNQTLASIKALAVQSGLNVDNINDDLDETGETLQRTNSTFKILDATTKQLNNKFNQTADFLAKFTNNTAEASTVFAAMSKLPFGIGIVASAFERLALFQQANLTAYQTMSSAGVNFAGSLTDMRLAAQKSFITLDRFAAIMKENGQAFALMGGNVNEGAMAFAKMSNSLIDSDAGRHLLNLGYTAEQVNTGMLDYISISGSRTKKEMTNSTGLIASSVQYMEQLDGLARITGKNREEQAKALKEASLNAAWQAKEATMLPAERDKANAALAMALATGGKHAVDALQAELMGLPPLTEGSQAFVAMMAQTNAVMKEAASNVWNSSKVVADQHNLTSKAVKATGVDLSGFGSGLTYASIVQGKVNGQQLQFSGDMFNRTKNLTEADYKKIESDGKTNAVQVANAVNSKQAMDKLGQAILNTLMPAIAELTPWIAKSALWLAGFAKTLSGIPNILGKMATVIGVVTLAFIALKASVLAQAMGGGAGGFPMKMLKGLAGGAVGLLAGLGLDYASDKLKESGHEKAGAAVSVGSSMASGAGTGAMIGSMLLPGPGTAIGAALGAAAGGIYGFSQNKKALLDEKNKEEKPVELDPENIKALTAAVEATGAATAATSRLVETPPVNNATAALQSEVSELNKSIKLLLVYMKTTAENTERTYRAIGNANNQFAHN